MGLGVFSLQITYYLFEESTFLIYNSLIFLIGLHTCVTYSSQVSIWDGKLPGGRGYLWALLAALMMAVIYTYLSNISLLTGLGLSIYIFAKFIERIRFNWELTLGRVSKSYRTLILYQITEILSFTLLISYSNSIDVRITIPSFILLTYSLFLLVKERLIYVGIRDEKNSLTTNQLYYSMHAFFLLAVLMIDRIALSFVDFTGDIQKSDYLLLFSYASAFYAVGVAIIEVYRPRMFLTAKECTTLSEYLTKIHFGRYSLMGLVVAFVVALLVFPVLFALNHFSIDVNFRLIEIWILMIAFFSLYVLLMCLQIFFIAKNIFFPLFFSWSIALVIRLVGMISGNWIELLGLSILSGILGIIALNYEKLYVKES